MSKAVSWSVKGLDFDVREAAQEAARREGMTLGEWLRETISDRAERTGIALDELADDDRLEAVAARLHELDRQKYSAAESRRPHARVRQDGEEDRDAPRRPMPRQSDIGGARAAADIASRPDFDAEALLGRAVELFQRQSAKNERRTADALASVARVMEASERRRQDERVTLENFSRRLGDIESNLSRRTADTDAEALKSALSRLEIRLDAMARRAGPDVPKAPVRDERVSPGRAEMRAGASPRTLGDAIAQIAQRQRDLEEQSDRPASQADILALASKIEAIRSDVLAQPPRPAPACDLDRLHAEIGQMSVALHDLATRGSVASLETSIRRLADQLEISRREGANEAVLQPLERAITDLRRSLVEIDPRTTIAGLENQIKALDSKLENLGQPGLDPAAFLQVQQQTREIRDLLTAAAARPTSADRIEQHVAQLARRLEQQQIAGLASDGHAAPEALAPLLKDIAFDGLNERLDAVAARVEDALRASGGGRQSTDTRALEELVRGLAEKIEAVRAPHSDTRAIEALERQIGELAGRLERSSTGLASLPYLQQAIGDLFAKLEATQQVTIEAAEAAARSAVQESLREAAMQGAFDTRPLPGGADSGADDVARELAELRDLQDAADRRTHSTLNAVHETLEKIVDRLAMLEEELGDAQPQAQPATLASGPAPRFAAATRGDPPMASTPRDPGSDDRSRREGSPAKPARGEDLENFLIEPGRGFPGRDGESNAAGDKGDKKRKSDRRPGAADSAVTGRADFIAAARRAAQAAQKESAAAAAEARAATDGKGKSRQNLIAQARQFIAQHKRPVVLSVATVFLLIGAYAVFNSIGTQGDAPHRAPKPAPQSHARRIVPAPHDNVAQDAASLLSQVPRPAAQADPQKTQAIPGSDPIVVGTIKPKTPAPETTHEMAQAALQNAADLGDAKAQFELASRYAEGRGFARDLKTAAHWYEKSARQGLAVAQYRLGSFYEKGAGGARDLAQAKAWYLKAAEQGNVRAMHNLAVLMAEVGENDKPDYASAAQWFHKAAEYGVRDSQYNYAILLARGLGVAQNLAASYTWFAIAAAQGDDDAGKKREDVGARLATRDLAAAKAVAQAFHARPANPAANDIRWPAPLMTQPPAARTQRPKVSQL